MEKRGRGRPSKKDKELYNKINNIVENTTEVLEPKELELTEVKSEEIITNNLIPIKVNFDNIETPRQLLEIMKAMDLTFTLTISEDRLKEYPILNQFILKS